MNHPQQFYRGGYSRQSRKQQWFNESRSSNRQNDRFPNNQRNNYPGGTNRLQRVAYRQRSMSCSMEGRNRQMNVNSYIQNQRPYTNRQNYNNHSRPKHCFISNHASCSDDDHHFNNGMTRMNSHRRVDNPGLPPKWDPDESPPTQTVTADLSRLSRPVIDNRSFENAAAPQKVGVPTGSGCDDAFDSALENFIKKHVSEGRQELAKKELKEISMRLVQTMIVYRCEVCAIRCRTLEDMEKHKNTKNHKKLFEDIVEDLYGTKSVEKSKQK